MLLKFGVLRPCEDSVAGHLGSIIGNNHLPLSSSGDDAIVLSKGQTLASLGRFIGGHSTINLSEWTIDLDKKVNNAKF